MNRDNHSRICERCGKAAVGIINDWVISIIHHKFLCHQCSNTHVLYVTGNLEMKVRRYRTNSNVAFIRKADFAR